MSVLVAGAGVCGLVTAVTLSHAGHAVRLIDRAAGFGPAATSWYAGGMLAPYIEAATQDEAVRRRGLPALDWWRDHVPEAYRPTGSIVVAPGRDAGELDRFARRTKGYERLDAQGLSALEPGLEGRFSRALFFRDEACLDPRVAVDTLASRLAHRGVPIEYGVDLKSEINRHRGQVVDCRGPAACDALPELRGVRGEMLVVTCADLRFDRPVRLLHPRFPCYVVPRGDGRFMVGATQVESERDGSVTVRGVSDLLNALYALHPAFAEAGIVETGAGLRPAFPDNLPRVVRRERMLYANGLFRHGFLLSPALAEDVLAAVENRKGEWIHDETDRQRADA